jgi:hypothetical protein
MKKAMLFPFFGILLGVVLGCSGGDPSAADDKALRKQFAKDKVDINDVPPDQRARVQGFMNRAAEMRAKAQSQGANK